MFSGANAGTTLNERLLAFEQWKDTQPIIDQVYSPFVSSYKAVVGTLISGEGDDHDAGRLEYAVNESTIDGLPREHMVKVTATPLNIGSQTLPATTLEVDFQGLALSGTEKGYYSTPRADCIVPGLAYGYTISFECAVKPQVGLNERALGDVEVFVWSPSPQWVVVRQTDSVGESYPSNPARELNGPDNLYQFHTYPAPTTTQPMRRTIDLRSPRNGTAAPNVDFVSTAPQTVEGITYPRGTMRLRFTHIANASGDAFISSYDAIQVAPFPYFQLGQTYPSGIVLGEPIPLSQGEIGQPPRRFVPYTFEPMDPATYPYASTYYSNPIYYKHDPSAIWEPTSLADRNSVPRHYNDWHHAYEDSTNPSGHWPGGYNANTAVVHNERLLNSLFSLPDSNPAKQVATMRLTGPIWTNAPAEKSANLDVQPYRVWFWLTPTMQWAEVTAAMNVTIARDSTLQSGTVTVSSRATEPLQAGYYALTLNATPPPSGTPDPAYGERYAVYTGGDAATPGTLPMATASDGDNAVVQYNFRLYPDCNNDGIIDATEAECNVTGTNGQCPSDLDNGSGSGYPDGYVDVRDLLFFLNCWQQGNQCGDLDDGTGTGTKEGWVDINDLLYFLAHFAAGC